jgi:hypothetical protein
MMYSKVWVKKCLALIIINEHQENLGAQTARIWQVSP